MYDEDSECHSTLFVTVWFIVFWRSFNCHNFKEKSTKAGGIQLSLVQEPIDSLTQ